MWFSQIWTQILFLLFFDAIRVHKMRISKKKLEQLDMIIWRFLCLQCHYGLYSMQEISYLTIMDENSTTKVNISLNLRISFCTSTLTMKFFIACEIYTLEKYNTSLLCILCTHVFWTITLFIFTLVCTWYEESTQTPPP